MNKYQEALDYLRWIGSDGYYKKKREKSFDVLQELVDKATPMKPIQLEERKYSCPSCAMAFKLKTLVKDMFVNNQYCDVCGQRLDWSKDERERV